MIHLDPNRGLICIVITYVEKTSKHGVTTFEFINSKSELLRARNLHQKIESLKTWWLPLTWKDQNSIYSKCLKEINDEKDFFQKSYNLDNITYRELILKTCLKKWNAEIELNSSAIDNLDPKIAQELLTRFEEVTNINNEDLDALQSSSRKFFDGKKFKSFELPMYVYEHLLARNYGWSLEDIRDLNLADFHAHVRVCLAYEESEKHFKVLLAGGGRKKSKSVTPGTKGNKEVRTEKLLDFQSTPQPVRIPMKSKTKAVSV